MYFSIVTATYNRKDLLHRLYKSLLNQRVKDFEWIVIDDGSFDGTSELLESWRGASHFPLIVVRQVNSGKHRALNAGLNKATSIWTAIIDSDDWLTDDCLDRAKFHIEEARLDDMPEIAGLIFLSKFQDEKIIGTSFPASSIFSRTYELYDKYAIAGDKFDFYKTKVLQKYEFPEFDGERFISEGIVWNRINKDYRSYFVNEALQYVEYQSAGLTNSSAANRAKSPKGAMTYYKEAILLNVSSAKKIRHAINFYRFERHLKEISSIDLDAPWYCKLIGCVIGGFMFKRDLQKFNGDR